MVVISREDYEHLRQPKPNFVEMIRNSPLIDVDIDLARDKSPMRDIDL